MGDRRRHITHISAAAGALAGVRIGIFLLQEYLTESVGMSNYFHCDEGQQVLH